MTACNACSTRYSWRGGTATSTISCTKACAQNGHHDAQLKSVHAPSAWPLLREEGAPGFASNLRRRDSFTNGVSVSAACTCAESVRCAVQSSTHDPDEALWETEGAAENM